MLMNFAALAILFGFAIASAESINEEPLVISNAPEDIARDIFVGTDNEMPINGRWRMSISPTIENGEIIIPDNLHQAFLELESALPHWYQVALRRSGGNLECFVSVNNLDLNLVVMSWLWVNWRLEEPDSALRKTLESMGAENRDQVLFGIHDGFCFYLKYGEEKALELLALPVEAWDERMLPPLESSECEEH